MYRVLSRIGLAVAALFVLGGLSFGASQAFGNGMVTSCTQPEELGTCPPFTTSSCDLACRNAGFPLGGACLAGCCSCIET